jgi:hypothetical protein
MLNQSVSEYQPHNNKNISSSGNNFILPNYKLCSNYINFTADESPYRRRMIQDVDFFDYKKMSEPMKKLLRLKCEMFNDDKRRILLNNDKRYLPLMDDEDMKAFIKVCDGYCKMRNEPILCLGRSPKWFLNTALWMKGGISDYKFVAFSKFWYRNRGDGWGITRMDSIAPTREEEMCYRKYLKHLGADPKSIIKVANKTGKKVVITDYVNTGKGMTSFLDVMSRYAKDEGVLDKFAHSIRIYTIGSMEYMENFYHEDEEISIPTVTMPELLKPYKNEIKQEFHNMPLSVFNQMLINENTNECRSTYYPHEVWTIYNPSRFKTGMLSNSKVEDLRKKCPRSSVNFSPAMRDYRNLLNFRILDYLNENDMLKESLEKQWD